MTHERKQSLRKELIDRRKALDAEAFKANSLAITEHIRALPEWKNAREVLVYWPVRNEVDTRPLIAELWQREATVLLPRCRKNQPGIMDLACVTCEADLKPGMYSIMEPDADRCPVPDNYSPDVALIPGVGYDEKGFRLGYGGGYYDRILARTGMKQCFTIGLSHDFQRIKSLPVEQWDKPVRAVCTEKAIWRI